MTRPHPKLAVVGATGFVGSGLLAYGRSVGADIGAVALPRVGLHPPIDEPAPGTIGDAAARWRRANPCAFDRLCAALAAFDVVINAAGDARASAGPADSGNLLAANAVLPAVVAGAAHAAGVRRMVHVSTAAVQGRLDPLDETALHLPLSPYAASKAQGERFLLEADPLQGQICDQLVVYRPTSVQAVGHRATRSFVRLLGRLPAVPVGGATTRPVPVVQFDNVAAGILFAAAMPEAVSIVLQPDEAMTVQRLLELFGARRIVPVPSRITRVTLDQVARVTSSSAYLTSRLRWAELLLRGQATRAKALMAAGFVVPVGDEGWEALARSLARP